MDDGFSNILVSREPNQARIRNSINNMRVPGNFDQLEKQLPENVYNYSNPRIYLQSVSFGVY